MAMFRKTQLLWMVDRLNAQLATHDKQATAAGELLKWFGVLMLVTRFKFGNRANLWSETTRCKCIPAPSFGKTGMSRQRWDDLWRFMEWSCQPFPRPETISSEHWRWSSVQDFVNGISTSIKLLTFSRQTLSVLTSQSQDGMDLEDHGLAKGCHTVLPLTKSRRMELKSKTVVVESATS